MGGRQRRVSEFLPVNTEDKYRRLDMIGAGSFSKVYVAVKAEGNWADAGKKFVVKDVALEAMSPPDREAAISEVVLHAKLDHPNIIKYIEVIRTNPAHLCIVLEFAAGGDMAAFLQARKSAGKRLSEREGLVWFTQVLSAVEYLHRLGMIHRDIKAANIFLSGEGQTKLGDFNLSKSLECNAKRMSERTCRTPCGTPMYNSPEQWLRMPYTQQVDIWAMGCLLYEMLLAQPCFIADSMENLHRNIHHGHYDRLALNSLSPVARDLIISMLSHDPRRRPLAKNLLRVPLIQEVRGFNFFPLEFGGPGIVPVAAPNMLVSPRASMANVGGSGGSAGGGGGGASVGGAGSPARRATVAIVNPPPSLYESDEVDFLSGGGGGGGVGAGGGEVVSESTSPLPGLGSAGYQGLGLGSELPAIGEMQLGKAAPSALASPPPGGCTGGVLSSTAVTNLGEPSRHAHPPAIPRALPAVNGATLHSANAVSPSSGTVDFLSPNGHRDREASDFPTRRTGMRANGEEPLSQLSSPSPPPSNATRTRDGTPAKAPLSRHLSLKAGLGVSDGSSILNGANIGSPDRNPPSSGPSGTAPVSSPRRSSANVRSPAHTTAYTSPTSGAANTSSPSSGTAAVGAGQRAPSRQRSMPAVTNRRTSTERDVRESPVGHRASERDLSSPLGDRDSSFPTASILSPLPSGHGSHGLNSPASISPYIPSIHSPPPVSSSLALPSIPTSPSPGALPAASPLSTAGKSPHRLPNSTTIVR